MVSEIYLRSTFYMTDIKKVQHNHEKKYVLLDVILDILNGMKVLSCVIQHLLIQNHVAHLVCQCAINSWWPSDALWWHRSGSTMALVMACCLMAPSHYMYLNQCWLIINEVFWHSPKGNFTRNTQDIYLWCWYEFENCYFRITAASLRGQWV